MTVDSPPLVTLCSPRLSSSSAHLSCKPRPAFPHHPRTSTPHPPRSSASPATATAPTRPATTATSSPNRPSRRRNQANSKTPSSSSSTATPSERVYFEAGNNANGPLAYMTDWANNDARTEGMSYGMMIAVQMDHKREFDALWNWSNTYMLITDPKNPNVGYFAWSMNTDGTPRSTGPAPDGEEYYAWPSLRRQRWGNGQGIYNYQEQADRILRSCATTRPDRNRPLPHPSRRPALRRSPANHQPQHHRAPAGRAQHRHRAQRRRQNSTARPFTRFGGRTFSRAPKPPAPWSKSHSMVRFVPASAPTATPTPAITCPPSTSSSHAGAPKKIAHFWAMAADVSRELLHQSHRP